MACFKPAQTFEGDFSDIRALIASAIRLSRATIFTGSVDEQFFTDRRYKGAQYKQIRNENYGPSQIKYKIMLNGVYHLGRRAMVNWTL